MEVAPLLGHDEGASLSDLTRAMRINRPSLYAAFGNKEQLFRKALDRYVDGPLALTFGPENVHGAFQDRVGIEGTRSSALRRSSF
jgi:AcrR family transcriptional regulator